MIALAPRRTRNNCIPMNHWGDEYAQELAEQYTVEELTAAREEYRRRYELAMVRAVEVLGEVRRAHGVGVRRVRAAERVAAYLRYSAEVLMVAAMYSPYRYKG